jgi:beta-N-acetylhexosaminidase
LLPPAARYAKLKDEALAHQAGWLMAAELIAHDIDLSFAPVLDQGEQSKAIGNRAFGDNFQTIVQYTTAFMAGMKSAGMATTGKHFPGHGGVTADSHLETPVDNRDSIFEDDMRIFQAHIKAGVLDAMMPAHVVFPHYDDKPASGSSYWLKEVLRKQLGFNGIVFSDDLSMEGAAIMGGPAARAQQALDAGCDTLLMCNNRNSTIEVLDNLPITKVKQASRMLRKKNFDLEELKKSAQWKAANSKVLSALEG